MSTPEPARRAIRSVRRICRAGLRSVELRAEVMERLAPFIPHDAHTFATTDPDTGLLTHAVTDGVPDGVFRDWAEYLYPYHVAREIIDLAASGATVSTRPSEVALGLLQPQGFGHDLRGIVTHGGHPWGFMCFLRDGADRGFDADEAEVLRHVVPYVSEGIRTAAAVEQADLAHGATSNVAPGVLVLDERGRVEMRTPSAAQHLDDLGDAGREDEALPFAVASAVAVLRQRAMQDGDGVGAGATLPVQGRSGRWYVLRALLSEPDADGRARWMVLIEVAAQREVAPILTRLYGLTPREREVLALVARGRSTRAISRALGISPYTVQEHVGNACDKVGVRSRKMLLAKLFFDGYGSGTTHSGNGATPSD